MSIVFPRNAYRTCPVCAFYASRRATVLEPEFALRAFLRGVAVEVVAHEYMTGVHARHLAGGSLSTRRRTPVVKTETGSRIKVQRICNGCGEPVGDARDDEIDAAISGEPLPDVRRECGCHGRAAA